MVIDLFSTSFLHNVYIIGCLIFVINNEWIITQTLQLYFKEKKWARSDRDVSNKL